MDATTHPEPAAEAEGNASAPDLAAAIAALAALPALDLAARRKAEAARLGINLSDFDKGVKAARDAARAASEAAAQAEPQPAAEAEGNASPADLAAAIAALAALPRAELAPRRRAEAARLGMTLGDFDAAVKAARATNRAAREAAARASPPPAPGVVRWPGWAKQSEAGLYFDPGDRAAPVWLAAPFDVMGEGRAPDGTGWGLWLRWSDGDGRLKTWLMPFRLLMVGPGEAEAELVDKGLRVSADPAARMHLRRALAEVRAGTKVTTVSRAGWHGTPPAALAYVQPNGETIGRPAEPLVMAEAGEEAATRCATAGTLAGWQAEVAALAVDNAMAAFALSCAFGGPLLLPLGEVSGGFHLAGGSKGGKTSAFLVAATAWGPPHKGAVLRDWNSTANAFEVAAEEAGDGLLILDEIHQADPRAVVVVVYALAGEAGKARLNREAKARRPRTWRTFILSNGEVDVATMAAKAGIRLPAGAAVRLPSVPVPQGGAAWPNLHGAADFAAFMTGLHGAMKSHHGHAAPAFIAKLAEAMEAEPDELKELVSNRREYFAKRLPADAEAQARDVARRFALVATAGELATAWGILPWPEGEATRAAEAMMAAWLASRGGAGAGEDADALSRVRRFIAEHGASRFAPATAHDGGEVAEDSRPVMRRAGFRKVVDGADCYLFFRETWAAEVFDGADAIAGAKALDTAGFLITGEGNRLGRKERVPGWPGGAVRFYCVKAAVMEESDDTGGEGRA
jgi:putative DNA primase/helicase